MHQCTKAIIGGTGVEALPDLSGPFPVETPYGVVETYRFTSGGEEILFLPRHGQGHTVPPHAINYRAQMKALQQEGVSFIYALLTSGSMDPEVPEGSVVVIEDFLDFTSSRMKTFYDGSDNAVAHVDMSDPYCSNLRSLFIQTAQEHGLHIQEKGVYVCSEGPRFEGKAEIAMFQSLGGSLVGMTGLPEMFLAKELGICYSAIGLISNMACGLQDENLAQIDHGKRVAEAKNAVLQVITDVFASRPLTQNHCDCSQAVLHL